MLFNANSAIFWLNHGENMLIFNEMIMVYALFYSRPSFGIIALNGPYFYYFFFAGSNPRSTTLQMSMLTIAPPMQSNAFEESTLTITPQLSNKSIILL